MPPWLRAGALSWLLPSGIAIGLAQGFLPPMIVLPQLFSSVEVTGPAALLLATVIAVAAVYTIVEPSQVLWTLAMPRHRMRFISRLTLISIGYLGATAITAPGQFAPSAIIYFGVLAEGLISAAILGYRLSWILPLVHVAAAALLGAKAFGGLAWWAQIATATPGRQHAAVVGAGLALGVVLVYRRGWWGLTG